MATDETRAEASNPGTSPARLQELTSDTELWPLIAANPNAYDALLTWLGENGGPDVQAAIAARGGAAEPTSVLPSAPPAQAGPPLTPPPGAAFPPPGGVTPPPAGFPAPGTAQGGSGGSKKGLWITLAVLVFLLVGSGIGVGVWALTKDDDSNDDASESDPTDEPTDDSDDDSDRDNNDDEDTSSDFCDVIDDVDTAAFDVYLYFPGLDETEDLEDAQAVLEDNVDDAPSDVADAMEVLIDYADLLAGLEDSSEIPTDASDDASDAYDVVFDYYLDC